MYKQFSKRIEIYTGLKSAPHVKKEARKFSLIVIGPLDNEHKKNTGLLSTHVCSIFKHTTFLVVNQTIEMHSRSPHYFENGSIMLIFQPVEVEGKKPSGFFDWEPQSKT